MCWCVVGFGRAAVRASIVLTSSLAFAVSACSDGTNSGDGDGGSAGDAQSGAAGRREAAGSGGNISGMSGNGGATAEAGNAGTAPGGSSAANAGTGGDEVAGMGGAGGASGADGMRSSAEVAAACATPLTSELTLNSAFGWRIAMLQIDTTAPSCALIAGEGMNALSTLTFAHESNGSYSVWSSFPWDYEVESGGGSNNLPKAQAITVFPFLENVRLKVVFSFTGETVTVSTVAAE